MPQVLLKFTIAPHILLASQSLSYEALFLKPTTNATAVPINAIGSQGSVELGCNFRQFVNVIIMDEFCDSFSCVAGDWKPQRTSRLCTKNVGQSYVFVGLFHF